MERNNKIRYQLLNHDPQPGHGWTRLAYVILAYLTCLSVIYVTFSSMSGNDSRHPSPSRESDQSFCLPSLDAVRVLSNYFSVNDHLKVTSFVTDEKVLKSCQEDDFMLANHWTSCVIEVGIIFPTHTNPLDMTKNFCSILQEKNLSCHEIDTTSDTQVTHIIITSTSGLHRVTIQASVFIPTSTPSVLEVRPTNLLSIRGEYQFRRLFDTFNVTTIEIVDNPSLKLVIPEDVDNFLLNKRNSRFVDCDRKSAKAFPSKSSAIEVQANTRKSIIQLKELMRKLTVPFWLMSGTLLGWYRECKAIDYTTDADFGTWATFANPTFEEELLRLNSMNRKFRLSMIFGRFDFGYEMSFLLDRNFKSDLFFLYKETNNAVSSSGHVTYRRLYYKYFYPDFDDICTTIFLDVLVHVPCDPVSIIEAEYGLDWRQPVKDENYDYKKSPRNKGPPIHYPNDFRRNYRSFY